MAEGLNTANMKELIGVGRESELTTDVLRATVAMRDEVIDDLRTRQIKAHAIMGDLYDEMVYPDKDSGVPVEDLPAIAERIAEWMDLPWPPVVMKCTRTQLAEILAK